MEADLPEDDAFSEQPYQQCVIVPGDPSDPRCPAWARDIHACFVPDSLDEIPHGIFWRNQNTFAFLNSGVDPDCQLPNKAFFKHIVASERAVMLGSSGQ
jgi:hypothetical protein